MRFAVLGAGSWGTALALVLSRNGHEVVLWGHRAEALDEIRRSQRNERYLPGIPLPESWHLTGDLAEAISAADVVILAIPSKAFREVAQKLGSTRALLVSVTKGIEYNTGLTMTDILRECVPGAPVASCPHRTRPEQS